MTARLVLFYRCRRCLLFGCAPCNVCFVRQDNKREEERAGGDGTWDMKASPSLGQWKTVRKWNSLSQLTVLPGEEPERVSGARSHRGRAVTAAPCLLLPPPPLLQHQHQGDGDSQSVSQSDGDSVQGFPGVSSVPLRRTLPQLPLTVFSKTYDLIISSYSAERGTRGESPPARRTE